jgi:predicted metallopeptidase
VTLLDKLLKDHITEWLNTLEREKKERVLIHKLNDHIRRIEDMNLRNTNIKVQPKKAEEIYENLCRENSDQKWRFWDLTLEAQEKSLVKSKDSYNVTES